MFYLKKNAFFNGDCSLSFQTTLFGEHQPNRKDHYATTVKASDTLEHQPTVWVGPHQHGIAVGQK